MNNQTSQQFNALQKATAQYQNDAKMADHMRRREVDLMNRASEQNKRDEEQCRIVHGNLGEEIRKAKTLEAERKRYKDGIENDRRENVTVTSELKGKEVSTTRVGFLSYSYNQTFLKFISSYHQHRPTPRNKRFNG